MHIARPVIFVTSEPSTSSAFQADAPPADLYSALEETELTFNHVRHLSMFAASSIPAKDGQPDPNTVSTLRALPPDACVIAVGREVQEALNKLEIGHTPMASPRLARLQHPERLAVHVGAAIGRALLQARMVDWTPAELEQTMPSDADPFLQENQRFLQAIGKTGEAIAFDASPDGLARLSPDDEQPKGHRKAPLRTEDIWASRKHMVRKDDAALRRIVPNGGLVPDTYDEVTTHAQRIGWRREMLNGSGKPKKNLYQPVLCTGRFIFYINPDDHPPAHMHVFTRYPNKPVTTARLGFVKEADGEMHVVPYYYSNMILPPRSLMHGAPAHYMVGDLPAKSYAERFDISVENLNLAILTANANAALLFERWQQMQHHAERPKNSHLLENERPDTRITAIGAHEQLVLGPKRTREKGDFKGRGPVATAMGGP